MKTSTWVQLGCTFLVVVSPATAWPWPAALGGILVRRQDGGSSSTSSSGPSPSPSSSPASNTASNTDGSTISGSATPTRISESPSRSSDGSTTTGSNSASPSETGSSDSSASPSGSGNQTSSDSPSSTTDIDPRLPPGGIQMITPAPIAGRQYYKIGDNLTFAWNYTSLSVTPTAIDVMASCSLNSNTYTIARNQSVQSSQAVTWDTGKEATGSAPLPMATYTLLVYDAAQGPSATASAGYLSSFDQFQFAMYVPREYQPVDQFKCASCSGAMSSIIDANALRFAIGMVTISLLSFSWFLAGAW